jgi:hypothetical protein
VGLHELRDAETVMNLCGHSIFFYFLEEMATAGTLVRPMNAAWHSGILRNLSPFPQVRNIL